MNKRSRYGSSLKDFKLGDQIGYGGFAKVFKAKCLNVGCIGEYVAIKRIEKKPQKWKKVNTEVNIHSSLPKHPAVVEFYTSFEDENYWYLVMELCSRGSLEKYLERKGPLSENEAVLLIKQVIEGVSFLHANGILHRDLSLRNLLLSDSQNLVKIVDLGLAVKLDFEGQKRNDKVGTANFMAPEVVNSDPYSYEADYWSVGCVLYSLLYGSPPFHAETKEKIQRNIKQSKLQFPDKIKISAEAKNFLKSLLNKNPEKRISFQKALRDPLFQPYGKSSYINQICFKESNGNSGMSSSSNSQLTHTSSNGTDQYKSEKEKKNKSVKRSNISGSHDNLSENIKLNYQSHQVISQEHKFDHPPYLDRNSKENGTCMYERNTSAKKFGPTLNSVKQSSYQMKNEGKGVNYQKSNGDSDMSSSYKPRATHTSNVEQNPLRSHKNNSFARSHDKLPDNTILDYQYHQDISLKDRFYRVPYEDRNSKEKKTYRDQTNTSITEFGPPLDTVRKGFPQMKIEGKGASYQNSNSSMSSSSKSQSSHMFRIAGSHVLDNAPHQDRQIKENKNYTGVQNTNVEECLKDRIEPLNTTRLKPLRKESKKDVMISILSDGKVCLECFKRKKQKKYVYLFYLISSDGDMINIYKPKNKILLNPDQPPRFSVNEHEVQHFTFENLPRKEGDIFHWRNYNFAKMFVDSIRGTTIKITIYSKDAVCRMMENSPNPNYKMEFYNGKYNGFEISEKYCKLTITDKNGCADTKKDWNNSMLEEFEHMKLRCKMVEENIIAFQYSTFPVTLGAKPNLSKRAIPDDDKENSSPTFLQSPSINGINSGVPTHIISTNPESSFNSFQRSTSTFDSGVKSSCTTNTSSYKSIRDSIPEMQDLKVVDKWVIAEYIDGIQMWLSTENDDVLFRDGKTPLPCSMKDNPKFKYRFENDSRRILRCAINISKT